MLPFYENWRSEFHAFEWLEPHGFLPHIHHQLELMYVVEGSMDATVDFQHFRLQAGDLAVILPHAVHSYAIPTPPSPQNRIWGMVISPSLTGDFEPLLSQMTAHTPFISADKMDSEVRNALRQMFSRHYQVNPLLTKGYLQVLLAHIWSFLTVEQAGNRPAEDILHRVIEYVLENYRRPLRAADVSAALGISTSYLARTFSKRLHMNFNEYVNRMRVQAAQELLSATDRPITEVMLEIGFESQATFNRVFREELGISPRQYRKQTKLPK